MSAFWAAGFQAGIREHLRYAPVRIYTCLMRVFIAVLFVFCIAGSVFAMSVQEIGRLSELKTSDSLILQMIEKNGLADRFRLL